MSELGGQEEVYNILGKLSRADNNQPVHYSEIIEDYSGRHDVDIKPATCLAYLSRLQEKGCVKGKAGAYTITADYYRKNKERHSVYVAALTDLGGAASSVKIADRVNENGHSVPYRKALNSIKTLARKARIFKHPSIDRYYLYISMYQREREGDTI